MLCFFSTMKLPSSFNVTRISDFLSLWQRGFEAAPKCSASSCQGQSRGGRKGSSELACGQRNICMNVFDYDILCM